MMKSIKYSIYLLAIACAVSCYDDSKLKEDVSDLQKRVTALETLCTQINTNLIGIQTLVNSLNNNDYITSVTPIKNGNIIIGYTISFLKSAPINIYNGENGKDGNTPIIGVAQDIDGIWYWTLGDNWLLDNAGQKVRASGFVGDKGEDGKDAIAPQLKIVDEYWYISTDNGKTWTILGKAVGKDGKDGDSMFKEVTYDDKYAYFTLVNGTVLTIPLSTNIPKLQLLLDKEADIHLTSGGSIVLNYSVISPTGAKTTLSSYESANWKVLINKLSETNGTITITAPNPVESGKILLILSDDFGNVFMKSLEIIGDSNIIKIIKTEYTIDEFGGYLDVAVEANLGFTVQVSAEGKDWITTVSTGTVTRLYISPNADYNSRTAFVRFKGNDGETYQDITITQMQNNAIVISSNQIYVSENEQTYNLIVRANVDCVLSLPSDISWIRDVSTRALVEKVFTLRISENEDYATRSAVVVVSDTSGKIKQTITLTQAGYTPVYISIPDDSFSAFLVENYDLNGDRKIDQKEAAKVKTMDCSEKAISSLSGIEYFVNLTSLNCSKTQISGLNISSNTKLSSILCQNNERMSSLQLPPISSINNRAFLGCTALKELDLPNTITSIGADAFLNCSSLEKLIIRSDINTTYVDSFSGAAIHDLYVKDRATKISNYMFQKASVLEHVVIGENITSIGQYAFGNCINLDSVTFEKYSKLTTIEKYAFYYCDALSTLDMTFCQELAWINMGGGSHIFTNHSNTPLLKIYLGARVPPSTSSTAGYRYLYLSNGTDRYFNYSLFVPYDCIDAYKASSFWYNPKYVTIDAL